MPVAAWAAVVGVVSVLVWLRPTRTRRPAITAVGLLGVSTWALTLVFWVLPIGPCGSVAAPPAAAEGDQLCTWQLAQRYDATRPMYLLATGLVLLAAGATLTPRSSRLRSPVT